MTIAAVSGVSGREAGLASGLINTSQQIGGALGLAILATIANSRTEDVMTQAGGDPQALPTALTEGFQNAFMVGAGFAIVGALLAIGADLQQGQPRARRGGAPRRGRGGPGRGLRPTLAPGRSRARSRGRPAAVPPASPTPEVSHDPSHPAAVLALCALLVAAAPAAAKPKKSLKLSRGATTLTLDKGAIDALTSLGIAAAPLAPATADGADLAFPITTGRVKAKTLAGTIRHTGGLALSRDATRVELRNFIIDTKKAELTARVGNARIAILDLDLSKVKVEQEGQAPDGLGRERDAHQGRGRRAQRRVRDRRVQAGSADRDRSRTDTRHTQAMSSA